ncbi:hypothetical protein [Streptomyces roseoverticillatus]|uniref:hypothetical protein n=1 Tax=Streptomyces roseoverticillatus TaxID=66429 RepID=UPI0004BF21BC|nr:hypothetical protein [Streptomyces roseoverticillatus]
MRDTGEPRTRRAARLSLGLALGASALLTAAAGPALAAPAPAPADIPDYQAALDTVKSQATRDAVCRFLSAPLPDGGPRGAQTIPARTDPCQGVPSFTVKLPAALYEVTPAFAAGTARPVLAEALRIAYVVSPVSPDSGSGRSATVLLAATQGGGWHLAGVRESDSDGTYPTKGALGATVFSEPQLHAWYQLKLDSTVEPLNDAAKAGLDGKSSVSLADYQNLVKGRYADKLPGSDYDTKGFSSGFRPTAPAHSPSPAPLIIGGSGAALALAGGTFAFRRRRRAGAA